MANFGQFSTFCILSHKKWLRWTRNGQFCSIGTFSNLFPPKWLIFGQISKILFPGGGGTSANFARFCNFWNCLQSEWLKMTHNGHLATEVAQIGSKWPILVTFNFPTKSGSDGLGMANSADYCLFQSFPPKWLISGQISNIFFPGGVHQPIFSDFATFQIVCNKWLKMTHNGQYCHRSGSDWLKMANFG